MARVCFLIGSIYFENENLSRLGDSLRENNFKATVFFNEDIADKLSQQNVPIEFRAATTFLPEISEINSILANGSSQVLLISDKPQLTNKSSADLILFLR
jgi:hypothetical protein